MSSLEDLLSELRKEYVATIPAKVRLIDHLWSLREMTDLETEYHKLKGTGRTYGLGEITQIGEAVERLCEKAPHHLGQAVPLSLALLQRVQAAREHGKALDLEKDADFQTIVALVTSSDSKP